MFRTNLRSLRLHGPIRSLGHGIRQQEPQGIRLLQISRGLLTKTEGSKPNARSSRLARFFQFGLGIGLVGGVLYSTNDSFHQNVRHGFLTFERVSVVTIATFRCFKLYKDVLDTDFESSKERSLALKRTHKRAAQITLRALETNGGIYIKLGQHITALTYLLPEEWTSTMIPLQDRCPESTIEDIREMFEKDLGVSLDLIFSDFCIEPVGVASLAQVHMATLKENGQKVAVKVQHPSLQEFVPLDVKMTMIVFELMRKVFPEYPLTWLGEELHNSIFIELDFTKEAENSQNTEKFFKDRKNLTALRIPDIIQAHPRILVMECVSGSRLDNIQYLKDHNIEPAQVSSCLSHIFNSMIFEPGAPLHCDPHGGNLAIRYVPKKESKNGHNFEIILYDHGLYRYIPLQMKRDYAHFWLAVLDNDIETMKVYAEKIAGIRGNQKFRIFLGAITGRDPNVAMSQNISSQRTKEESQKIQSQLHATNGALEDLMTILSTMPRMVLLILKTNDLTRNLDESLENPLGPERTFLILAKYCADTLYDETKSIIASTTSKYSFKRIGQSISALYSYQRRVSSLWFYDLYMMFCNFKNSFSL